MEKKASKKGKEFITSEEATRKVFVTGMRLGFDLGGLGERVAPLLMGKKDSKEIAGIIKRELGDTFRRSEEELKK